MSRHLLFVLLLASAVALAADKLQAQSADGATVTEKKTEPAQRRTDAVHAKPESAQRGTQEPQLKKEEAQGQAEKAQAKPDEGAKLTSVPDAKALGMSILGNQDAPKSLVIVPWKSSELGATPGISPILDDSRQPVDKEVFMRALRYYEIRSKTKP
jgi:hypothetical protein